MKTLGLDIGSNSIGWAILDGYWFKDPNKDDFYFTSHSEQKIVAAGVHTFPMSLNAKNDSITSAAERRNYRSIRRNYDRRRRRKINVIRVLSQNKLCPPVSEEELLNWKYKKKFPITNTALISWMKQQREDNDSKNPYYLRHLALSQKLDPYDLGRVMYHLSQRRGFLSNRKEERDTSNRKKEKDTSKSKFYESIERIDRLVLGKHDTIGDYFYHCYNKRLSISGLKSPYHHKIRNRSYKEQKYKKDVALGENNPNAEAIRLDRKKHYEHEFEKICTKQNLDPSIKKELYKAIFFQRPLKSQKLTVGKCTLEPSKTRCPMSNPVFELFRMHQLINNIRITINEEAPRPLMADEFALIESEFYLSKDSNFEKIAKILQKHYLNEKVVLNYDKDTTIKSNTSLAQIMGVFSTRGNKVNSLHKLQEAMKNTEIDHIKVKNFELQIQEIWHTLFYADLRTEKSEEEIQEYLSNWIKSRYTLSEEKAEKFSKIELRQGYARLSFNALKNILVYLEQGLGYSESVFLANLYKVFGIHWDEHSESIKSKLIDEIKKYKVYGIGINIINDYIAKLKNGEQPPLENFISNHKLKNDFTQDQEKYFSTLLPELIKIGELEQAKFVVGKINYIEFAKKQSLDSKIDTILKKELSKIGIDNKDISKKLTLLYHPSKIDFVTRPISKAEQAHSKIILEYPDLKTISNPVYLRCVHQVRKLLLALLEKKMIDKDTRIIIELARDVNTINARSAIRKWQNANKKKRDEARDEIQELKGSEYIVSEDEIKRFLLWKEQEKYCLYTGKNIKCTDILGADPLFDIEHTIPKSKFYDNSMANLTLCESNFNRNIKKNQLPSELGEAKHNEIIAKINTLGWFDKIENLKKSLKNCKNNPSRKHELSLELQYWEKKCEGFTISAKDLEKRRRKFASYQLPTTKMISSHVRQYLQIYFEKVYSVEGQITSQLRKSWLSTKSKDDYDDTFGTTIKNRSFHTHHVEDAVLIALAHRNLYNKLTEYWSNVDMQFTKGDRILRYKPWKNFTVDVHNLCEEILPTRFAPYNYFKNTKRKKKDASGKPIKNKKGEYIYIKGRGVRVSLHDVSTTKDKDHNNELCIRPHHFTLNTEKPKYYWSKAGTDSNYLGLIYVSADGEKKLKVVSILETLRGELISNYPEKIIDKKQEYVLYQKLHPKQRVILYEKDKEEIKELIEDKKIIQGRMFDIQYFEKDNRLLMRKSTCATDIKEENKKKPIWVNKVVINNILRANPKNLHFICEHKDFDLDLLGNLRLKY